MPPAETGVIDARHMMASKPANIARFFVMVPSFFQTTSFQDFNEDDISP
jgi:hypothetical protein